jgi:DNA-binding GntR family transcriptional regulator
MFPWDVGAVRTLSDRLAETLREAIVRGDLLPGQPLRQVELSRQLNVSFAPLREALRQLEAEGFVRFTAFQGAIVAPLDTNEMRDFIDILAAIETIAARAAVPHITPEVLAEAERLLGELVDETDHARAAALVLRIRLTLYAPSGRHRLNEMVRLTRLNSHRWARQAYIDPVGRRLANEICRGLIECFRAGDAERAARFVADTYHEAQLLLERTAREIAERMVEHPPAGDPGFVLPAVAPRRKRVRRRAGAPTAARPAPRRRRT